MVSRITAAISIVVLTLAVMSTPPQVLAAVGGWMPKSPEEVGLAIEQSDSTGQMSFEGYTGNWMTYFLPANLSCQLTGCLVDPAFAGSAFHVKNSMLGQATSGIAMIYDTPPANTMAFIYDTGQTLGFIPRQAYAQGTGFTGLAPILPIWKAFRNLAYLLLAFVMIIVGFMIIFRRNIDPHTVVTIQNALPRIVLTLILITFSYAIVGLLIDLMYVGIFLAYSIFYSTGLLPDTVTSGAPGTGGVLNTREVVTNGSLYEAFHLVFPENIISIAKDAFALFDHASGDAGTRTNAGGGMFNLDIGQMISDFAGDIAGQAAQFTLGGLFTLALSIGIFFIFVRLFFVFISAYINIIVSLVFGPLQILMDAIPGTNSFDNWLRNLIGNIAVFPVASVMIMLALVFHGAAEQADATNSALWTPPYYDLFSPTPSAIGTLFSLGVLLVIPQTIKGIKESIKGNAALPIGLGSVFAPAGSAVGGATSLLHNFYYLQSLGLFKGRGGGGGHGGGH